MAFFALFLPLGSREGGNTLGGCLQMASASAPALFCLPRPHHPIPWFCLNLQFWGLSGGAPLSTPRGVPLTPLVSVSVVSPPPPQGPCDRPPSPHRLMPTVVVKWNGAAYPVDLPADATVGAGAHREIRHIE